MAIRQYISNMTPKGWAMLGGAAAAAIVFLMLVMNFASAKSYSTMLTGLDPAQTSKLTSTLDGKGIGYQIQNGGTALAVDSSQVSQARIALASAGLLGTAQPGFSLFDKSQLGASNFQQQITYQRALEGQLDTTIEQIQGVDSAQVNLVLPNPQAQLFADNSQPATASVLLSDSGNLDPSAVRGIAESGRLERAGPAARQSDDHRRHRPAAVADVGERLRRLHLQAGSRQPVRREHGCGGHRPASPDARRG